MQKQPRAADKRPENTRLVNCEVLVTKPEQGLVFFTQALLVLPVGCKTHKNEAIPKANQMS